MISCEKPFETGEKGCNDGRQTGRIAADSVNYIEGPELNDSIYPLVSHRDAWMQNNPREQTRPYLLNFPAIRLLSLSPALTRLHEENRAKQTGRPLGVLSGLQEISCINVFDTDDASAVLYLLFCKRNIVCVSILICNLK